MITKQGDQLTLITDISPKAVKLGRAATRQRILAHEFLETINSEGKELVVEIKVMTKQWAKPAQFSGTGRPLGDVAPHRAID